MRCQYMFVTELAGTHAYCEADVGLCSVGGVDVVCWACAGGADGHRISRVYLKSIIDCRNKSDSEDRWKKSRVTTAHSPRHAASYLSVRRIVSYPHNGILPIATHVFTTTIPTLPTKTPAAATALASKSC